MKSRGIIIDTICNINCFKSHSIKHLFERVAGIIYTKETKFVVSADYRLSLITMLLFYDQTKHLVYYIKCIAVDIYINKRVAFHKDFL